jgi:hypothetical protein
MHNSGVNIVFHIIIIVCEPEGIKMKLGFATIWLGAWDFYVSEPLT